MAELKPTLFKKELVKVMYPKNEFWTKGKKDDGTGKYETIEYNIGEKIAGYKQGAPPSYPVTIGTHTNGKAQYSTEKIWVPPIVIAEENELLTNFNKRQDVVEQMRKTLETGMADLSAYNYGPTGEDRLIKTTGDSRSNTLTNGTGNVKRLTAKDIIKGVKRLKKDNIGNEQIYFVATPDMWEDLLAYDADVIDYEKTGVSKKTEMGIIGRIAGVEIMYRWNEDLGGIGLAYNGSTDNKKTIYKADGTVNYVAGDRAAGLMFVPSKVRYVHNTPDIVINSKPPGYLGGTIIEAYVHYGATISDQTNEKGVVSIIEASA